MHVDGTTKTRDLLHDQGTCKEFTESYYGVNDATTTSAQIPEGYPALRVGVVSQGSTTTRRTS